MTQNLFDNAPFKRILTIDFETRWSSADYTLSKLTTEEYIRDPRFKAFGAVIHEIGGDTATAQWYRGDELPRILRTYKWDETAVLAHNAQFDVAILEWVYDTHPCFILDSLSMARALYGVEVGNSLAKLAERFKLPPKGNAVYSTDGVSELTPEMEQELAAYCKHDVYLCEQIFGKLLLRVDPETGTIGDMYPAKELRLIDLTLKMFTRPQLRLDEVMLRQAIDEEARVRTTLMEKLQLTDSVLASNDKFAEVLRSLNVIPPTKTSPTTGKDIFAFAKSDAKFQALLHGDREDVSMLCEARLKVKSTLERTRAQRFLGISQRGLLPVPLSYYGAATGRYAAAKGSQINMQNMKRGSFLRKAILAPAGHKLVVGDLSQIEPRVLGWLAGYEELLNIFRSGQDAYAMFGRQMFNIADLTKESHPDLRQSAKSALLGAGYGLGWASFAQQLLTGFLGAPPVQYKKDFARKLGVTSQHIERFMGYEPNLESLATIQANCSQQELLIHCLAAARIIEIYRGTAAPVTEFWELMTNLIARSLHGGEEFNYKDVLLFRKGEIVMPNGMSLRYPNIQRGVDEKGRPQWTYGANGTKLYAGKITNNVTQGLARIVMTDGMLRTSRRYFVAGTVHDEQIVVVPEQEAEGGKTWVLEQMTRTPVFLPGIPLAADGGVHERYGLAKG